MPHPEPERREHAAPGGERLLAGLTVLTHAGAHGGRDSGGPLRSLRESGLLGRPMHPAA
jgi:hypothetical protein